MNLPDYLEPLRLFSRPFPEAVVAEVLVRREEAIPHLLEILEQTPERWAAGEITEDVMLHEYAMHLLAEFGDTRTARPVARIARMPEVDDILGDSICEILPKVLAATWGRDTELILDLIGDPKADEYARAAGLTTIGILYKQGQLQRAELRALLDEIHDVRLEREPLFVWDVWISLVVDFKIEDELERVRTLYAEGLADPCFEQLESVERRLMGQEDDPILNLYEPYKGVSNEMSWWHCFSDEAAITQVREEAKEKAQVRQSAPPDATSSIPSNAGSQKPVVRESPKTGRNDPCPCGSGKKYKKCCLI